MSISYLFWGFVISSSIYVVYLIAPHVRRFKKRDSWDL